MDVIPTYGIPKARLVDMDGEPVDPEPFRCHHCESESHLCCCTDRCWAGCHEGRIEQTEEQPRRKRNVRAVSLD
jgi:hypothetical protein